MGLTPHARQSSPMSDPQQQFADYEREAVAAIGGAADVTALEAARVEYLGKKQGRLRDLQKLLGTVPKEEKRAVGMAFNEAKTRVQAALDSRKGELESATAGPAADALDVTLPGRPPHALGAVHPLTRTIAEFKGILGRLGIHGRRRAGGGGRAAQLQRPEHPRRPPRPRPAGELLPLHRVGREGRRPAAVAVADEHRADPGDGEHPAAGAGDLDRPRLPAGHDRRHAPLPVPPDGGA